MYSNGLVGGTGNGWSIVGGGSSFVGGSAMGSSQVMIQQPATQTQPAAQAQTAVAPGYSPYGGGTVGGSWSPNNVANTSSAQVVSQATGVQQAGNVVYAHVAAPTSAATAGQQALNTKLPEKEPAKEPVKEAKAEDKPAARELTVAAGDTLSKIASANNTTWEKLYEANKAVIGADPNLIHPGQKLRLP